MYAKMNLKDNNWSIGGEDLLFNSERYNLLLAEKGLTDKRISEISGVGRSTISQLKKGDRTPRPKTLGKIAKALGTNVENLINRRG